MRMRGDLILFSLSTVVLSVHFVDICGSASGNYCCAEGMENSLYWFMSLQGSWLDLDIRCRLEHPNQTHLVVLETRAELDCLLKFITDEFRGPSVVKYAIGLQSPDHYKGVYQWRPADLSPSFTNWGGGAPSNKKCVHMTVGSGATQNGMWTDVSCQMEKNLYGICERKV